MSKRLELANNKPESAHEVFFTNPFEHWDSYHPSPKMKMRRDLYEPFVLEAVNNKRKIEKIITLLELAKESEVCHTCSEMKCYGSLYPICEPVLQKLKDIASS